MICRQITYGSSAYLTPPDPEKPTMTATPPWGTPAAEEPQPLVPGRGYFTIVEQLTGSGDSMTWRVDPEPIPAGHSREEARAAALHLARTFQPRHPFSPKDRTIFRVDEDSYLVVVVGLTRTFHFRVTVAERLT
ncbi:MAG TPA: hypothetical protein VI248_24300 [Kineosporiaceae bacterium]